MTKKEKQDAYALVTDRILEALEQGIVPWHRPWKVSGVRSLSTGKAYQGVNVWTLTATAALRGYSSPWWGTYKQIAERGGNVRKGEKATPVVFWKWIEKKNESGEVTDRIPLLRYFSVFNLDQCDGLEAPDADAETLEHDPIEAAERIQAEMQKRPTVQHGGDSAHYVPALDIVQMPYMRQFDTAEHYYGTLFHELVHATGHSSRLNRKGIEASAPFGTPEYSREELIAEMGAAFLCGLSGLEPNIQHHAGYIGSWLKVLQNDRKMVVQAAAAAQKAANYIAGDSQESPALGLPTQSKE